MNIILKKKRIVLLLSPLLLHSYNALATCTPSGNTLLTDNTLYFCSSPENYDKVIINTTMNAGMAPLQGYGIYADGDKNLKEVEITTTGSQSDGIQVNKQGDLTFEKLTIKTSGSSADGINVTENLTVNATVTAGDNTYIETQSGIGIRANISKSAGTVNTIKMGDNLTVITHGNGSNLIDSVGYGIYAGIRTWKASTAAGDANVIIGNNSTIITNGSGAHAIYANSGGDIQLGSTTITTNNSNAYGIYAQSGSAGGSSKGSTVDLLSDVTITVPTSGIAIYANGVDSVIASRNSDSGMSTSGIFNVTGDIRASSSGLVDLVMTDGSYIQGNTIITNNGQINFDIDGSSSKWLIDADSTLTNLILTNNAKTILGDQTIPVDGTNSVTLTTDSLSGNGIFEMRTEIDGTNNYHDLLKVTGTNAATGNHKVAVNDSQSGAATVDGTERVMLVETEGGSATFTGNVDIGAYAYTLDKGDTTLGERDSDWYLRKSTRSNTANNSASILNINYLMNYVENQTILQRLGELRQSRTEGGDVWGRIYTGTLNSFENSNLSDSKLRYSGFQLGIDKNVNSTDLWDVYVGFIAGMSKGMTDFNVGDGNTTSYYAGFYGTYKEYNGFYLDLIAKYMYMDNKFNTETAGGYGVNSSGDSQGYTIGLELGKRFWLNDKPTAEAGSWFVEPQGQITYGYQSSATIKSSNGLKTKLNEFDSVLGRVGTLFGYTTYDKGNNQVDVYIKLGYVKEYDGNTSYIYNGTDKESYSFKGHWIDSGIGINTQINHQHNLYLDFNYATGNRFDQKQVNFGYRYNF